MPKAFFVVRATVSDPAQRQAFDAWYSREHVPDAVKSFGAEKAWRYWSLTDPSLHHAMYQFADKAALDRAMNGADISRLVADFNRDWPDVDPRTAAAGGGVCGAAINLNARFSECSSWRDENPRIELSQAQRRMPWNAGTF